MREEASGSLPVKKPASTKLVFGRERRIRRRADFVRVQSDGLRAMSTHFVLLVAARLPEKPARGAELVASSSPEAELHAATSPLPSRLGVVATRKVGDATMRNRIKRVCRECFRQWPGFVPDGIDLVVIAREGAHALPLAKVREEWSRARPSLLKRCEAALRGERAPRDAREPRGERAKRPISTGKKPTPASSSRRP